VTVAERNPRAAERMQYLVAAISHRPPPGSLSPRGLTLRLDRVLPIFVPETLKTGVTVIKDGI